MSYDVELIRSQFPALDQEIHGHALVYLDNAATSQKPQSVIDAVSHYYERDNSNVHRGVHTLSERATEGYEGARKKVADFLGAASEKEIIFTRGTTEAINLVAQAYARPLLKAGDEVLITHMEHHSNIVPWQMVCRQTGATLKVAPINDDAELIVDEFEKLLSPATKIVAFGHVSNALGSVNPVKRLASLAKAVGAVVLVDGAQATPHCAVNVVDMGVDFYAFSGHKVYGPTGIGALYGRAELLEAMEPWQGGGEMIKVVRLDESEFNSIPHKFEAGTPNISGAIGLGAAIDFIDDIGVEKIGAWESELLTYATQQILTIPGVTIVGTAADKAGILSFKMDGVHAADLGTIMDRFGVAIRAGHHCAMPAMERFGLQSTTRASFACYNTLADVDSFIAALKKARDFLV
jgi:cysteine desulfurase/selenocysteine lyase